MEKSKHKIVISGSFRRHYDGIKNAIEEFERLGVEVLSPKISRIMNPGEPFPILETDDSADPETLERRHLAAIEKADVLYLYNPDGYLGDSAKMELGWALALGKPIFRAAAIEDIALGLFSGKTATPAEVVDMLARYSTLESVTNRSSIPALQTYVHDMVIRRGFDKEKPQDILLLLIEEIGEVAKAMRKHLGLKTDQSKKKTHDLEGELADVFIYLLDLANSLDISLIEAFKKKEEENEKRTWS
jgi:NTP pyrophosphatase (non-canonical NTP hydrolase)